MISYLIKASKQFPLWILAGATLLAVSGCNEQPAAKPDIIRPVKFIIVQAPSLERNRSFPGRVEATDKVDLAFKVAGALTDLPIKQGQQVKKGQALAKLDSRDYRSNYKAASAEFTRAKADYKRASEIFKRKLISKAEVDRLKATLDIASTDVEKTLKALNDTTMKAPFSGVIANLYVDNFQDVNAKEPILSLQDNSALDIVVQVPESVVVKSGRRTHDVDLKATFEAFPEQSYTLSIKEFSTEADPDTQTFQYVLTMPAPKEINALPGMSVTVTAQPRFIPDTPLAEEPTIKIPATALFADPAGQNQQFVWIYDDASETVNRREVSIGLLGGSLVEISSGLEAGERIVTAGVHYLQPGQKVRLFDDQAGVN